VLRQDIAVRQEISAEYIAQIIRHLSKEGLVESTMGPGGGYRLASALTRCASATFSVPSMARLLQ